MKVATGVTIADVLQRIETNLEFNKDCEYFIMIEADAATMVDMPGAPDSWPLSLLSGIPTRSR